MKTVNVDVLEEHYPAGFRQAYESWVSSVCGVEDFSDVVIESVRHHLLSTGWLMEDLNFRLSYSQGDGVGIEAEFLFEHASSERQDAMRREFPMCTELMRLGFFTVNTVMVGRDKIFSRPNWEVDLGFWPYEDDDEVIESGIYKGLPIATAENIANEEGFEDFAAFLYIDIEAAESGAYRELCEEYEHRTSEEMFIEWARDFDEEFEVEDEHEEMVG